tara:strand:- start:258 stop:992 length:735 start_codon:yes stop_codon:yes gene_type:complete
MGLSVIDLHCHLLHGLDDGPGSLEESLQLCRIAAADGITHAIVTPHIHPGRWDNTRKSIKLGYDNLRRKLDQNNIPLQLGFAAEVRVTDQLMQQVADSDLPYYGEVEGYKVLLLEFPHSHLVPGSEKLFEWLLHRGIRPLVAHPERNRQVMKDASQLQPFIDAGCWLQVTAGSVTGHFGEKPMAIAHQLLQEGRVKVLASDGHNAAARPPVLGEAYECIAQSYGEERARQLMLDAPAMIAAAQI